MDGGRFDDLVRGLAGSASRRSVLKGALGAALAGLLGTTAGAEAAAKCRGPEQICRKDGDCCSKLCGQADSRGRRRCQCPPGQEPCKGVCVDPAVAYQGDPKNCGACGAKCPRPSNPCMMAACSAGVCGEAPNPARVGRACDDKDPCTENDVCQADGTCKGTAKVCTSNDPCKVPSCDARTGSCVLNDAPPNTPCNADNSACTADTCQAGVCVAGAPKDCSADPAVNDQCNTGVCDPASGQCVKQAKQDGTACNADDSKCTQNDTCQAGSCTPGTAKSCPDKLNDCQINGTCDPATGNCVYEIAPATTPCDDGNPLCFGGFCCASPCRVYSNIMDTTTGQTVCCPSGQTCSSVDLSSAGGPADAGICCSGDGCLSVGTGNLLGGAAPALVCCASGESCQPLDLTGVPGAISVGVCCAGEACLELDTTGGTPQLLASCCASGTACKPLTIPSGLGATGNFPPVGLCCATDACLELVFGGAGLPLDAVCCAAGETCQSYTVSGTSLTACCAGELCPTINLGGGGPPIGLTCCASDETCQTLTISGSTAAGACCPSGQGYCVNPGAFSNTPDIVCCDGECVDIAAQGLSVPFQACCPAGQTATLALSGNNPTIVCGDANACPVFNGSGITPQTCPDGTECTTVSLNDVTVGLCCTAGQVFAVTLTGNTPGPVCCDPANACTVSGVPAPVCCAAGQTCDASRGCVAAP